MSHVSKNLRLILAAIVAGLAILFGLGIVVALIWPARWDSMLGSLFLSIIASLFGVLVGVFAAIFIVEKYLERQRREAAKKEAEQEAAYRAQWQAYIHGGVAFDAVVLLNLCLFVVYGKKRSLELLEVRGDTSNIPDSIGDFVHWYMQDIKVPGTGSKDFIDFSAERDEDSRGIDDRRAASLAGVLSENPPLEVACTTQDLSVLADFLQYLASILRDQFVLFQPFVGRHMEFGVALMTLVRGTQDAAAKTEQFLIVERQMGGADTSFLLDEKLAEFYRSLGQKAAHVIEVVWADARDVRGPDGSSR